MDSPYVLGSRPGSQRNPLAVVERAELALRRLSSAEPRLGQPRPPFRGAHFDLWRLTEDRLSNGLEIPTALGDVRELALEIVELRRPRPAERVGVVGATFPVVALQHQRPLGHEQA